MPKFSRFNRSAMFVIVWSVGVGAILLAPHAHAVGSPAPQEPVSSRHAKALARPNPDLSGHKRVGEASFYSKKSTGKKMADGTAMRPHGSNAASKTLPLGTTAKVTNIDTGQSAVVTIQDRGPHVNGRIVDLSPSTAQKIGITRDEGVAKVEVAPISVPMPDGSVKSGVAAQDTKTDARPSSVRAK
ncbi:MAG: septal ring lytic transglycosylase RlpA family protein [Candidatus Accumulibacter phosphatis]|jgi:rare lipoprotein A|uniref:Endolytic peptidoglycan transglycosylase RlpA n=2 Tax=Candidatus Accumulibacter TaxID=327159 RepID=A0A080M6F1_9PROT|nr:MULTISPECIES: septal ring lytic transglycosylase RlpA family protein [Candidatus Accumulibacter]KFB72684.1 MAG: RlpA-like protein precursor [Candidatus Accumulibacter phosphatis]MBL8407097.1 septal ring lytic transglycosylase RlpA family protein [Accumulibacter sp.]NMQ05700.1 septal ring lytic transglycosylase RlpA family protein [Candidatus Accumulibacter contiguus]HRF13138.1 septal ring lytic transglycosylase RlpA family protein [Candidatus Accumulibacter phosphatis]